MAKVWCCSKCGSSVTTDAKPGGACPRGEGFWHAGHNWNKVGEVDCGGQACGASSFEPAGVSLDDLELQSARRAEAVALENVSDALNRVMASMNVLVERGLLDPVSAQETLSTALQAEELQPSDEYAVPEGGYPEDELRLLDMPTEHDATVIAVHVAVGDLVAYGQPIADIDCPAWSMEVGAHRAGTVTFLSIRVGSVVGERSYLASIS